MHLMCVPKATLRLVYCLFNLMKFVELKASLHNRSKSKREQPERIGAMKDHSNPDVNELKIGDSLKKLLNSEDTKCLTQEIYQLEKQLEDQLLVRSALEKAFTCTSFSTDDENPITKPVQDLMKEISDLESQVVYLEKHLLSLYRETFDQNVPTTDLKSSLHRRASSEVCWNGHCQIPNNLEEEQDILVLPADQSSVHSKKVMNSGINRSQSTLTGVDPYHSFPLSMLENSDGDDDDHATSSSLFPRTGHLNHVSETPNWISEEMIKFISAIYCELASDPHFFDHDSPQVSFFTEKDSSPHEYSYDHTESRQMSLNRSCSSLNSLSVMQFNYRDNERLKTVKHMLWSFKLLVSRLERVDAKIMTYEEKLAFWINVHNALIMHAYIVYGIPYSNLRRKTSLVLKAAYIVGGHAISVEMIQHLILGCRLIKRQGQTYWLQSLFNLKTKSKAGSEHHVLRHYALDHEEHRLYFGLCWGNHSDPMVRVFTPNMVFDELEAAKEDYIRRNIIIVGKKQKIILPKIVYLFARDSHMSATLLVDMIKPFLSEEGKRMKKIEWMSHNFDFRYLIARELVNK